MLYFATRAAARAFAARKATYRLVDRGADADRRWAVSIF